MNNYQKYTLIKVASPFTYGIGPRAQEPIVIPGNNNASNTVVQKSNIPKVTNIKSFKGSPFGYSNVLNRLPRFLQNTLQNGSKALTSSLLNWYNFTGKDEAQTQNYGVFPPQQLDRDLTARDAVVRI